MEIVRRIYDALARRDTPAILALYDPEVEVHFAPGTLADHIASEKSFARHDGIRTFDRELRASFEDFETILEEVIETGERVVSASRYRGRGRRSGVEIEGPLQFGVWSFSGGMVTRVDWYASRAEALEAVS